MHLSVGGSVRLGNTSVGRWNKCALQVTGYGETVEEEITSIGSCMKVGHVATQKSKKQKQNKTKSKRKKEEAEEEEQRKKERKKKSRDL